MLYSEIENVNITTIQEKLQKYITPSYKNINLNTYMNNNICDDVLQEKVPTSYVDNSVFVNAPSFAGSSYSPRTASCNEKDCSFIAVIVLLLTTTAIIISGIFVLFDDPYIKFKLSRINKHMKYISDLEIKNTYKKWYSKFIKRTFRKFICKMAIITSLLVSIITIGYVEEYYYVPLLVFCASCVTFAVMYCLDRFNNDKEILFYKTLVKRVDLKCSN